MPVIQVTGPALGSEQAARDLLVAVNAAVAHGLGLRPADVYSAWAPTWAAMLGETSVEPWPVAVVYGSARPAELTAAALDGLRAALVETWRCAPDQVWVQWVVAS
jgi:hypothetical protein